MDYRELKQALQTWKVILTPHGDGVHLSPAVKKTEDEWREIYARFAPAVRKHEWAIRKHLLQTWSAERTMAYLQEWGIGIALKDGSPQLVRNDMDPETWAYHTRTVFPHLKANRTEIIEWFTAMEPTLQAAPLKPLDERAYLFDVFVKMLAPGVSGAVAWFSRYTRETGYLQGDARFFPGDATATAVMFPDGSLYIAWTDLPGHTPPPGWKLTNGVMPPYPCLPPPGWKPRTEEQIRKERSRWYAENWKTAATFKEDSDDE